MSKQDLDNLVDEALDNIRNDRKLAREFLNELANQIAIDPDNNRSLSPVAAKHVETMQRSNEQLVKFKPQSDYLKLIVYEGESAIFLRNGVAFSAKWVWALKSFIDKKFIKNFKKLSEMGTKDMENAQSNNQKMLCGGCGSKVGNVILESSLSCLLYTSPSPRDS